MWYRTRLPHGTESNFADAACFMAERYYIQDISSDSDSVGQPHLEVSIIQWLASRMNLVHQMGRRFRCKFPIWCSDSEAPVASGARGLR